MIMGNKGEWSEVYALFKVISDGHLYPGDSSLNRIPKLTLPVLKIFRDESHATIEFTIQGNNILVSDNVNFKVIPILDFKNFATSLIQDIKKENGTFNVKNIELFMASFNSKSLKAKSTAKSDIRIVVHDLRTNIKPELGFSIKSELGNAATLLNAGRTTNFVFRLTKNLSKNEIDKINSIDSRNKIQERLNAIFTKGSELEFVSTESQIFNNNLTLIDSSLPKIVSNLLLDFFSGASSNLNELVGRVGAANPLNYDLSTGHEYYSYKIKKLLTEIALGMMPGSTWTGIAEATGGFLIVKESGDIVSYHIYNRNHFEDYLINSTKFETASSQRHGFGSIYENKYGQFFNLNLQIRFKK